MSILKPSPPASPTTMAFYAWLERPPSPLPIPVPLTPRQLFPLPISPISFNTILSPDSTPPSPSSPIITKKSTAARAVLSPIKEYSDQHQEPPEVDVLLRLYEAQNAPEHVLRNLRKI